MLTEQQENKRIQIVAPIKSLYLEIGETNI
jgi:hypothetical protein